MINSIHTVHLNNPDGTMALNHVESMAYWHSQIIHYLDSQTVHYSDYRGISTALT